MTNRSGACLRSDCWAQRARHRPLETANGSGDEQNDYESDCESDYGCGCDYENVPLETQNDRDENLANAKSCDVHQCSRAQCDLSRRSGSSGCCPT